MTDEELLIAVANTGHQEHDEFADPSAVRDWWRSVGGADAAIGADGPPLLHVLRALIRARALRNNGIETEVDTTALDALALRSDLSGDLTLRAAHPGDLARDVCAASLTALLRASARPSWPRFKACRGEDCRFVFVDASRNSSRRWCDMANCGNRAKSASFRDRQRAGR
jgi:predicted RNA-binding Zn ribbon-like protein